MYDSESKAIGCAALVMVTIAGAWVTFLIWAIYRLVMAYT